MKGGYDPKAKETTNTISWVKDSARGIQQCTVDVKKPRPEDGKAEGGGGSRKGDTVSEKHTRTYYGKAMVDGELIEDGCAVYIRNADDDAKHLVARVEYMYVNRSLSSRSLFCLAISLAASSLPVLCLALFALQTVCLQLTFLLLLLLLHDHYRYDCTSSCPFDSGKKWPARKFGAAPADQTARVRWFVLGHETYLENAAAKNELFLTDASDDIFLDAVGESLNLLFALPYSLFSDAILSFLSVRLQLTFPLREIFLDAVVSKCSVMFRDMKEQAKLSSTELLRVGNTKYDDLPPNTFYYKVSARGCCSAAGDATVLLVVLLCCCCGGMSFFAVAWCAVRLALGATIRQLLLFPYSEMRSAFP